MPPPPRSTLFPYTTLFRSVLVAISDVQLPLDGNHVIGIAELVRRRRVVVVHRSEEHTSELQSRGHLVCRLLLEKKKSSEPRRSPTYSHRAPCRQLCSNYYA